MGSGAGFDGLQTCQFKKDFDCGRPYTDWRPPTPDVIISVENHWQPNTVRSPRPTVTVTSKVKFNSSLKI